MSADQAPITAVQPSLRCPVHGDRLLAEPDGHGFVGAIHGERYPIADGIPVLLADRGERRRIIQCDWDQVAVAGGALSFYNQTRDHDRYCRDHLGADRENIQLWLHHTDVRGLVLDIGSGKGPLQGLGAPDYVALDYSWTALRRYIAPAHLRLCATAERLPFADSTCRFVFTVAALEHVPDAPRAFEEIDRVLAPAGLAYLLPAWHCEQYNCEGIPVRTYSDLTLRQAMTKASLPLRRNLIAKAIAALPRRVVRRIVWSLRRRPSKFHCVRLTPDYERFWMSDSDAAVRLDSHEACLFFHSRGYEILRPGRRAIHQLLARHEPVIVRKSK